MKVDVKCRSGELPFKEEYESDDGIPREAKHIFFARQIYDEGLDTDPRMSRRIKSVDAVRIAYDLVGRGILSKEQLAYVQKTTGLQGQSVKPILHPNQYHHLLAWLKEKGELADTDIEKAKRILPGEPYSGI